MAFEDIITFAQFIIWFAIVLFPVVYLLDAIRKRIEAKTRMKELLVLFFISLFISLSIYPFIALLAQYTIALETQIDTGTAAQVSLVLFDSDYLTYAVVLLLIFVIYLLVFNRTKE